MSPDSKDFLEKWLLGSEGFSKDDIDIVSEFINHTLKDLSDKLRNFFSTKERLFQFGYFLGRIREYDYKLGEKMIGGFFLLNLISQNKFNLKDFIPFFDNFTQNENSP